MGIFRTNYYSKETKVAKTDIKGKKKLKQILTTPQVHIKPPNYSKIKKNPIDYISRVGN